MKSFLTGVAVGFGVGLLIAPEAGSETRKKVVEKINVAKDQAQQAAEPVIKSVKDSAQQRIEQVGELVQSGMQRAQTDGEGMLSEASRLLQIFNQASNSPANHRGPSLRQRGRLCRYLAGRCVAQSQKGTAGRGTSSLSQHG